MRVILLVLLCAFGLGAAPATPPAADMGTQKLLAAWQPRLKADGFHWCISAPFVIAGDMSQAQLEAWRDQTVEPAVEALEKTYFKTRPAAPVLILLFSNEKTYRDHAKSWFGDTDVSYYGYFRAGNTMLMNISTGGGTLVHEMVHALLRPDFPNCPEWFNEGMGSLYEQCSLSPLKGLTNWRLPALQEAIRAGELRSLSDLMQDDDFYAKPKVGINYAQARYLLLYLQERGVLRDFYAKIRDNHVDDPTGLATLKSIIAPAKLKSFEQDWRQWVLKLHFQ